MFLNNMFQKSDHLTPSGKNPSPVDSPSIFYCLHQRLIPPLSNNFHVISQTSFIFSCSHCSCTIFISPSYSLHTQAMLIFFNHAGFNQCSLFTTCCFQLWKRFEWSKTLLLRFSSTHKTIPFPQQDLSFLPHPLQ